MIFILENHRIDNATRRCRSDKTKWFYQMLASDVIADPRTGIQVRDARVFRARQCTRKENPTDFPLMDRGLTVGFLRFGMNAHKPFFICGYSFQNELGFQRDGNSFGSGFPVPPGTPPARQRTGAVTCLGICALPSKGMGQTAASASKPLLSLQTQWGPIR